MTTTLQVQFPWGRYHATPWGRNVNEGHPEWPLSPWRIFRALFATWKTRCEHLRAEDVESALSQLARPPTLHVPAMKPAHLRHYMPQIGHRSIGKPDTTMTFDAFAAFDPRAPIFVEWDTEVVGGAGGALAEMAAALPYLGRSESICDAALVLQIEHSELVSWRPAGFEDRTDAELLCARQSFEMSDLLLGPDEVRRSGRLIPPGSRLVPYMRADPEQVAIAAGNWRPTYSAVRLAVHPRPRPVIADAVAVGELLRRAALKKHGVPSETLSGKTPSGTRRVDGHQHAHYLALARGRGASAGGGGLIDSLIVWAPGGLDGAEFAALAQVRWLRAGRHGPGVPDFALAVAGVGDVRDIAPEVVGPSRRWISHTPFAPGRHDRRLAWERHVEVEIRRELCQFRDFPAPASVTVIPGDVRRYRRYRLPHKETMAANRRAAMVEVMFKHPVEGPISLGSLSHFGLGLFLPEHDEGHYTR